MEVLVLGVGNLLLGDEGVGVHAVRALARDYCFAPEVELLDGGTAGMGLVGSIAEARHLIVIDAVATGSAPGTVVRLRDAEVPVSFGRSRVSPHQVGLLDVLAATAMAGTGPASVAVFGIEPASLEVGVGLTPCVAAALPQMVDEVVAEVAHLGYRGETRAASPPHDGGRVGADSAGPAPLATRATREAEDMGGAGELDECAPPPWI